MVVAPYIADDGAIRKRGVAEPVGVAAAFASFAAFWWEASSWFSLFVDAMSIVDLRSGLFPRFVLVLAKGLRTLRVCKLVCGCCESVWSFILKRNFEMNGTTSAVTEERSDR